MAALIALGLSACGDDGATKDATVGGASTSENTLSVTTTDYAFAVTGKPVAGTLTVSAKNTGNEIHELVP